MRVFTDLNLDGATPTRSQPGKGVWGPRGVPSTRWKKIQRVIVPIAVVAIAVALFFLGWMFVQIMTAPPM